LEAAGCCAAGERLLLLLLLLPCGYSCPAPLAAYLLLRCVTY